MEVEPRNDTEKKSIGDGNFETQLGEIAIDVARIVLPIGAGIEDLRDHIEGPVATAVKAFVNEEAEMEAILGNFHAEVAWSIVAEDWRQGVSGEQEGPCGSPMSPSPRVTSWADAQDTESDTDEVELGVERYTMCDSSDEQTVNAELEASHEFPELPPWPLFEKTNSTEQYKLTIEDNESSQLARGTSGGIPPMPRGDALRHGRGGETDPLAKIRRFGVPKCRWKRPRSACKLWGVAHP